MLTRQRKLSDLKEEDPVDGCSDLLSVEEGTVRSPSKLSEDLVEV